MAPTLQQLLKTMVDNGASDLHITKNSPPQIRIDGNLVKLKTEPLNPEETKAICYSILTDQQKAVFEENQELDLSFGIKGLARFRANIFVQQQAVAGAFRLIPFKIRSFNELGLPPIVAELCKKPRGMILVTGPTGSGKSTTLAAMVDKINTDDHGHIVTLEDPVEFLHEHKNCIVNQREIGADTQSFKKALKSILRQDPDCVLIGELRDLETIEAGLTIAETGHLVFGTLHTNGCVSTINRIIDAFPAYQQPQIRAQLSLVLEGVMSQSLVPKAGGGRALCLEVMVPTAAIRNLIREDKIHQVYSQMQLGQAKFGMQTANQSLYALYSKKAVSMELALEYSSDPEELRNMIMSGGGAAPGGQRPPGGGGAVR
jgi:twitching motility protein PilT